MMRRQLARSRRFGLTHIPTAFLLIWLFTAGTTALFAQRDISTPTGELDKEGPPQASVSRLEKRLQNARDKERAVVLLELAELFTKYAKSRQALLSAELALESLTIAKAGDQETDTLKVRAWLVIGNCKGRFEKYGESRTFLKKAETLALNLGDEALLSLVHAALGYSYNNTSHYDQALHYFKKCLPYLEKNKHTYRLIYMYTMAGMSYMYMGNYKRALELQLKALSLAENSKYKKALVTTLNGIGLTYRNLENITESRRYLERALELSNTLPPDSNTLALLNNLGELYSAEYKNYDKALEHFKKGLALSEKLESKYFISFFLHQIGTILFRKGSHDEALDYTTRALEIEKKISSRHAYALGLANLGVIYAAKKDYKKAFESLDSAMKLAEEIKSKDTMKAICRMYSKVYEQKKDYKKALEYHKLYYTKSFDLLSENTNKQVAEMQTRYDTLEKEKKIQLLEKNNDMQRKNRNYLIAALLMAVILLALLIKRFIYLLSFWKSRKHIAHYRIMEEIGSGGVGIV
ncbi:MAG: tetratricopeptide repeat protein, partial [bacterium]|nr:tetratricopeptide repeat protein [bacterium]